MACLRCVASDENRIVATCLISWEEGHGRHGISETDALVERGEHAELHPPPQGGLADEQAREWARRVEITVGEQADGLQLVVAEEVGFLDDHDGSEPHDLASCSLSCSPGISPESDSSHVFPDYSHHFADRTYIAASVM